MLNLKQMGCAVGFLFLSPALWAQTTQYYSGTQAPQTPCHVEMVFSADQQSATVRAVVAEVHHNELIHLGPAVATYQFLGGNIQKNGYAFTDKAPKAPIKQLLVISPTSAQPEELRVAVFHEGHHDTVTCSGLAAPQDLEAVEELFNPGAEGHTH